MLSIVMGLALAAGGESAPVGLDEASKGILKRPAIEDVRISPNGDLVALAHHYETGTIVEIVRRDDWSTVASIDPGKNGEVGALRWLGNDRVLVAAARSIGPFAVPVVTPWLYLLKVGDKHAKNMPGNFVATIDGDDTHFMVQDSADKVSVIRKLDIERVTATGELVAKGPADGVSFTLDRFGMPRFAQKFDDEANQKLWARDAANNWKLINDSKDSGIYISPESIARDGLSAIVSTEQKTGPDLLQRYDFATGARTTLLEDSVSDPLSGVYALDSKEQVGAWFGAGKPEARYWNPDDEQSRWRRAIAAKFPDAAITMVSTSKDGQYVVMLAISDRDPGTYYLFDRQKQSLQKMFQASPWIDVSKQLPTEPLTFKARDGLILTGFITLPGHTDAPPPMVVMVHGGPFYVRDNWQYDEETQLLAQRGYAVLRVNFRGSTGFGRSFVEAGARQWGAAMQDDVTDATRMAIANGLADPRRICIYGTSYGGYAALMGAAREPELYRCAAGMAGVYDLNRMYRWGDIRRSDYGLNYLHRMLGTDKATLAAHSPSELAAQITIPVLLAHGTLDGRVPIEHAKLMRSSLKKAGHPPEYVEYDYEGHGLSGYEHQVDFYGRLLKFLEANIGPGAKTVAPPVAASP
ncbi:MULTISPECIES: alpha/beta hydrolase family protein [Dyella]|uniref:S9 family peptidase n=2 Tax=Dyella TaxID=231454 RepID=A0A4R0YLV3_9GAMM|nr:MULTISPECIES: alpha/beta fold hydrolase [Dyella]TBR36460.1 S9 family peptidase [Dyella terrae]TCI08448.1 S9 family peptidase [Dyella soli]